MAEGWIVTQQGGVFHTLDSARTGQWVNQIPETPRILYCVEFVNEDVGWIGGVVQHNPTYGMGGQLFHITDGGEHWLEVPHPEHPYRPTAILDIHYLDEHQDYISTNRPIIYRTYEGGEHWKKITIPGASWTFGGSTIEFIDSLRGGYSPIWSKVCTSQTTVVRAGGP